ncbi:MULTISPECIES: class I SAM-dependent methyltransferase [unclassified Massilia]|uniref:methyltransferase n=1 Tax=unclassified Massilia TaxID=2609279 RepID=UPI001B831851|nr:MULTISPECIES: class I SAM-dependent methyltransferase [unclassified Massilia]MBQ5941648.1 class I SAM-dependent methyltransferase [Massilia sp. AB1]MBQ5962549.1 class I SAM-dependent methyltransferase [Massilia sp. ZL223]
MTHIEWTEGGAAHTARWRSESGWPAPKKIVVADDTMNADTAYRLALDGTALLWRGDFQNARQLLQALVRRVEHKGDRARRAKAAKTPVPPLEAFHRHRLQQLQRARTLAMLLVPFEAGHTIPLRRAPDARLACLEAYGVADEPYVASLRELLGVIGAHEWRRKGVHIPALDERIHPWYGVFSPVRGEYVELVAQAPLPAGAKLAFDIGAGTGVLSAVLARRGLQVLATDMDARALGCARENISRLGLAQQVDIVEADLFPEGRAPLVVCNPPWLPGKPSSAIEYAIYDPDSRMLKGFLNGLAAHLVPDGEGWLILSDLAEHLGLRSREQLLGWIAAAGLEVITRHDTRPVHGKASDPDDPLHAARSKEVTSLWRLRAA